MAIVFYTQLNDYRHHWIGALLSCTYLFRGDHLRVIRISSSTAVSPVRALQLFNTWTLALTGAYICHWLQVQHHAKLLRKFMLRFNTIATAEGLKPATAQMPGPGLRPMWIIAGITLAVFGAIWAIPMMLAGAAQRRLVRRVSTSNRASLRSDYRR